MNKNTINTISNCRVVDEELEYIKDGYLVVVDDGKAIIKHILTQAEFLGYVSRTEKITATFELYEDEFIGTKKYATAEDVVEEAKRRLAKRCKHSKELLVEKSVLRFFENDDEDNAILYEIYGVQRAKEIMMA